MRDPNQYLAGRKWLWPNSLPKCAFINPPLTCRHMGQYQGIHQQGPSCILMYVTRQVVLTTNPNNTL